MQLTIDVFFYGELAEHIGMNQFQLPLSKSMSVAMIKHQLPAHFSNWESFHKPIYNVLNRNLVEDSTIVNVDDVLAFFDDQPLV